MASRNTGHCKDCQASRPLKRRGFTARGVAGNAQPRERVPPKGPVSLFGTSSTTGGGNITTVNAPAKMPQSHVPDSLALFYSVMNLGSRVLRELPWDVLYMILDFLDRPRDIWHFTLAILGTKYGVYVHDVLKVLYRRDVDFQQSLLPRPDVALECGPPALLWAAKRSMHGTMLRALEAARVRTRSNPLYIDGLDFLPYRPKPREHFDSAPRPPLLVCAVKNDVRGCQLLLEYGADINIRWLSVRDGRERPWRGPDSHTHRHRDHCFRGTHKHCPHYSGMCLTAAALAASRNRVAALKYLLKAGADARSAETVSPLHMAVMMDKVETVKALLKMDPSLANFRSWRRGDHPLTVATCRYVPIQDEGFINVPSLKGVRICQLLLEHGAYVEARLDDEPCDTPLIYAARNGLKCAEMGMYDNAMLWATYCAVLLRAGAKVKLPEDDLQIPGISDVGSKITQWLDKLHLRDSPGAVSFLNNRRRWVRGRAAA